MFSPDNRDVPYVFLKQLCASMLLSATMWLIKYNIIFFLLLTYQNKTPKQKYCLGVSLFHSSQSLVKTVVIIDDHDHYQ
jgi:hypothetical protein